MTDKANGSANAGTSAAPVGPQPPQTIKIAVLAITLQIVLTIVSALLLWGYTSDLNKLLIKANNQRKSTDKNRRNPDTYLPGNSTLAKDLHDYRQHVTIQAVIICVLFALAAYAIWRGTGLARWLYIASAVLFSLGGIAAIAAGPPELPNLLSFLVALAVVVAVVLLMLPASIRFFATVKSLRPTAPLRGANTASSRPAGFRGLFAPPPPREPRPTTTRPARKPADTRPATRPAGAAADDGSTSSTGRGKPKARTGAPGVDTSDDATESTTNAPARGRGKSRRV